ncbi:plant UBX domain-containing protein 7 isoform X2 [Arachis ipaensis]|uniref:plant UBX domain-containing protein 7 isoform X2 n=1 Tax=Arachis ipaensis TaxID=130454 RepID=UPI0007AFAB75|nr:plant UBX domain-containing protein 7 isoform X2 [Arachis ipaensis]XP_025626161.1 plant UBX domain-containing protein 7 isoform X2 [Arachis hypogaea]QHO18203.1 Plant UBX domain-containing protein [Arachis hypogaea]
MEGMLSANDQQSMVSLFLEVAQGQTTETARQFLQATSWKLEEALQLFLIGNDAGSLPPPSHSPPLENVESWTDQPSSEPRKESESSDHNVNDPDEVRPPLPVIRETLYEDSMLFRGSRFAPRSQEPNSLIAFRNFEEEMRRPGVWETEQGAASTAETSRDNLASLYRPPFHLMFNGTFDKAKGAASMQDKWLLLNIQSTTEFSSHMLNRDTWANEAVSQTISTNFIFWQVYDDTTEGRKVCTYYKLESIPVVLIIDPITGQKMRSWSGMVQPESLLEGLLAFLDAGPKDHHMTLSHKRPRGASSPPKAKDSDENKDEEEEIQRALAASMEGMIGSNVAAGSDNKEADSAVSQQEAALPKRPSYPVLPEEPKAERSLLCRVGVRLPDGRRVQRNFLRTDPIQLLWSFISAQVGDETKPFRLAQAIPGANKVLDYESNSTFEESGLANSMIFVTWD